MRLTPLLDRWNDDPAFADLRAALAEGGRGPRPEVVVPDVARAFLLAGKAGDLHGRRVGTVLTGGNVDLGVVVPQLPRGD